MNQLFQCFTLFRLKIQRQFAIKMLLGTLHFSIATKRIFISGQLKKSFCHAMHGPTLQVFNVIKNMYYQDARY